jgi:hypothetical protein
LRNYPFWGSDMKVPEYFPVQRPTSRSALAVGIIGAAGIRSCVRRARFWGERRGTEGSARKIEGQQTLACELHATGIVDARYLAGLVARGSQMTRKQSAGVGGRRGGFRDDLGAIASLGGRRQTRKLGDLAIHWIDFEEKNTSRLPRDARGHHQEPIGMSEIDFGEQRINRLQNISSRKCFVSC